MNNDLISREALKKAMQNREECKECTDIDCISCFYEIIDNAPTINPLTDHLFDAYSKIADLEFEHSGDFWITTPKGKKIYFEKKRPHGKWISQFDYSQQHKTMPSGYGNFWWCNKCDSSTEKKSNFCPNCGADMRKEGGK